MSGGTLIALAADEIVMCEHSVLGPIDPQLGDSPAASLIKVIEQKPMAKIDDRTLVLADVGRKAITQVKQAARELLTRRLPAERASALAEQLATGTRTHDYPIWASTAKSLGLSVSTDMPDDVLQLPKLYPQPVHTQSGGVEYLPVPRRLSGGSRVGFGRMELGSLNRRPRSNLERSAASAEAVMRRWEKPALAMLNNN
jgi:ClpP class serine protease